MTTSVPFLDLVTPHLEDEEAYLAVVRSALRSASFIGGPMVESFEQRFAAFCDTKYCVGVGSGTDALRFALMAAGVRQNDLAITVPNTFIATTEAISQAGATPVFVDVDRQSCNMDPERLQQFLSERCSSDPRTGETVHRETGRRVSAVVPVHLYGQIAEMDRIREIAESWRLIVVEDACQAHGAEYHSKRDGRWRKAGGMGAAAAFSFYPGKNLGACGEAGAVTTNSETIAGMIRMLRDHGQLRKYIHLREGYNGRLDAIQAGILQIKLERLPAWNEQRRRIAERYTSLLRSVAGITTPVEPEGSKSVYHLYVIRTGQRNELQKFLGEKQIGSGLHYPIPLHMQQAYESAGVENGGLPVSEALAGEILSLPMFPGLTEAQQDRVVEAVKEFLLTAGRGAGEAEPRADSPFAQMLGTPAAGRPLFS
jgi:dTDP-4-amino-4,6-dideoxygalactose transaminase